MKKLLIVLTILLVSVTGLFARTYFGSVSVGYSYYYAQEMIHGINVDEKADASPTEMSSSIVIDTSAYYWFPFASELGLNVGMNVLFPIPIISRIVTENSVVSDGGLTFYSRCIWAPKIGVSLKVGDKFCSISSFGYGMMLYGAKFAANVEGDEGVPATIITHGIYLDERASFAFTENIGMELGAELFIPIAGNAWSEGGKSEMANKKLNIIYSGVRISPHLGVSISW